MRLAATVKDDVSIKSHEVAPSVITASGPLTAASMTVTTAVATQGNCYLPDQCCCFIPSL